MAELFSQQQLANVKNTATRLSEVFSQVEKDVALFSRFDFQLKKTPEEIDSYYKILSSGWENALNSIVLLDATGKIKVFYPRENLPRINLLNHFKIIKKERKQYLSVVVPGKLRVADFKQKTGRYIIIGCPLQHQSGEFGGAWIVIFSLAAVVNKYEEQARYNEMGEVWLIDENQQIIIHDNPAFIGENIKSLFKNGKGAQIDFSAGQGGYFEAMVRQKDTKQQRSVIAFYPLQAGYKRWILFVATPYSQVISPVRKTFVYTLFGSFLLILVVIIASISFAYKEGKRLRIKEGVKRLKEREDWQEKLLREKKIMEGIIEGSPIPSFVINNAHKVILWNRACTELTGYSAEDMLGTNNQYKPFYPTKRPVIADLTIDNEREDLNKYYGVKQIKKSDNVLGAYEAIDYFENLGGRSRFLYFLAAPIYDEKGEIIAAIETLQDISREKEMTRSLNEYAETLQNELVENIELRRRIEDLYNYLQTIITSLPDKIYEIDENGIINYMSSGLKKGGTQASDFKGKYFIDFVTPGYEEIVLSKWQDAKKGIYDSYEIEATGKDGRKHNLLITTSPVTGTSHFILVQRDITEFKNLEKELYESQKLSALGQLSAGIAHEIRNPLSSIKMSLQILAKRMNPEGNDLKRFRIAEKEVDHLEMLVSDILAFAKPVEPKKSPIALSKILEQAIALSEKGITDKKIEIQTEYNDIPLVTVDAHMMADAFLNIIRNAVEASKEHGKIIVSLHYFDETRQSVAVEIKDNGSGIDAEDMPHIFNPFFTRKNYGTGLGLSLVKKIIDIHQGTVDISSKKNEGTKVLVILPLGTESAHSLVTSNE
ncbi:MAG: PAS domain S-box protein [Smithella sp.]|nr:PAS domain S-box protein [Smithella sp.]